jgi:hypothetical protein
VAGVSKDDANQLPAGVALPIGALMAHIAHSEDFMINTAVQGKPTILEQGGFAAKLGSTMLLGAESDTARAYRCDPADMGAYTQAVFANTDAFLAGLKEGDLGRVIGLKQFGFPDDMPLGEFLTQALLGNTYAHTGEISTLKGILGQQGYPF